MGKWPIINGDVSQQPWLLRVRIPALVFLTATLSSTILLKIAEIQLLELIFLADLAFVLWIFVTGNLRAVIFRPYFDIAVRYSIFILFAILLSIYALSRDFYPYQKLNFLSQPLVMTIARSAELLLDVFYMLYLANAYRKDEKLCIFGMKTYFWVGIASCIYSIMSYPLNVFYGWSLGTYLDEHRMRGFYNEGGPYGIYLISLLVVSTLMWRSNWLTQAQYWGGVVFFTGCLVMSRSKAALVLLPLMIGVDGYLLLQRKKHSVILSKLVLVLVLIAGLLSFNRLFEIYRFAASTYGNLSFIRSEDGNFVMGRVAGAVLAPRMIAAHPLAGIGWGNYGLVRDDPQYRQGTAFTLGNDAPSLGEIDYIVDLGIPLWLYLTWIEFVPFQNLLRRRADLLLLNLALIHPLSVLVGAHLNLTYPWAVGGFALGIGYSQWQEAGMNNASLILSGIELDHG